MSELEVLEALRAAAGARFDRAVQRRDLTGMDHALADLRELSRRIADLVAEQRP